MKIFQELLQDIRQGENIDLYLLVAAAIVSLFLQIIGLPMQAYLLTLILSLVALISISMLKNRKQIESLINSSKTAQTGVLSHDFPRDFQRNIEKADTLWIIGVGAARIIVEDHPQQVKRILKRNGCVNILIVDPKSPAYQIAIMRDVMPNEDYQISRTKATINALFYFKKLTSVYPPELTKEGD